MPVLSCAGCGADLPGDVWVVRETKLSRPGGRRPVDARIRRTVTLCRDCWNAIDRPLRVVELPCRACGRIRHCDASAYHGARFQSRHACSPDCARTARRRSGRVRVTLRCDWCGDAFTAARRTARFCSTAHRKAAHRAAPPGPG